MSSTTPGLDVGTRVLLPNYQGQQFIYGQVLAVDGPNVKVRLERRRITDADFWTAANRVVVAREQARSFAS